MNIMLKKKLQQKMNLHDSNELICILLMIRQQVFYFNKNEKIFLFCLNDPKISLSICI